MQEMGNGAEDILRGEEVCVFIKGRAGISPDPIEAGPTTNTVLAAV